MNYNPKSIINVEEHGDNFEILQSGLDWLLSQARHGGYQALVTGNMNIQGITRYAVNQVTQHTDINNLNFNLVLTSEKKVARASSSLLGETGLEHLFAAVENNLAITPEIPFYQGLADPQPGIPVDLSAREWSIEERSETVTEAVDIAMDIDPSVITAGTASSTLGYSHIMSTEGIDVETSSSDNYFKINAILGPPDARGYGQQAVNWKFERPDIHFMSTDATKTAKDTLELKTMDAGEYEVLLGAQAVADLMVYVVFSADATSFHESNSFATDKLGAQIFDHKLTLRDLPRDPRQATIVRSFDIEGIPTQNRVFIENGVLKFIPYDTFTAAKYLDDKSLATGHAAPIMFGMGAMPVSICIDAGNRDFDDQINDMKDGLFVKNFWYNRFTKRREGGLTGLTRNGLFHVKDGEIQGAVRNLRYTESFVKAFSEDNLLSLSRERTKYQFANVPSAHLAKFNFSSVAHTSQALE